jgi:hypothetical protein
MTRNGTNEQETALALHKRLAEIDLTTIAVLTTDRHCARKESAKLARQLFSSLKIKGVSVRTPNYSMAMSVDIRMPKRSDYVLDAGGMIADAPSDPACIANREAEEKLEAILAVAFPNHDNRSDTQTDHFDYKWSVN